MRAPSFDRTSSSSGRTGSDSVDSRTPNPLVRDLLHRQRRRREIFDIFEGTEQIQQLVIARAISGLRIE
jgi:alkylation response protein AidB-like acyl-CoA dehydrogenase